MFRTRRTKYFSSLMGGVEDTLRAERDSACRVVSKSTQFGAFTILFCCRIFWFDRLNVTDTGL